MMQVYGPGGGGQEGKEDRYQRIQVLYSRIIIERLQPDLHHAVT